MTLDSPRFEPDEASPRPSPAVSVVIPAYRAARYIGEALDSVLAQTFSNLEAIVVNDASPDSAELERVLSRYDERVRYIARAVNGGPGAARNTGILAAAGEYLAFLDADDYWEPDFLSEQLAFLAQRPEVSLVYSDARWFVEGTGETIGSLMSKNPSDGEPTFEALVRQQCTVGTSAVVVRRAAVIAAGLFDPEIGNHSEDFDLYLRIAKSGARLGYHRKVLVHHRVHAESLTAQTTQLHQGALRVLRKTARRPDLTAQERAAVVRTSARIAAEFNLQRARLALERRDFPEALDAVGAAHAFYRTWKLKTIMLALRVFPRLVLRLHRFRAAAWRWQGRQAVSA
jgi:glycosyltransferase involved in cell wall biosynthesis